MNNGKPPRVMAVPIGALLPDLDLEVGSAIAIGPDGSMTAVPYEDLPPDVRAQVDAVLAGEMDEELEEFDRNKGFKVRICEDVFGHKPFDPTALSTHCVTCGATITDLEKVGPLEPEAPLPEPPSEKVGFVERMVKAFGLALDAETKSLSAERNGEPESGPLDDDHDLAGHTLFLFGAGSQVHRFFSQTESGCVDLLAAFLRDNIAWSWSYTFIIERGDLQLADLANRTMAAR